MWLCILEWNSRDKHKEESKRFEGHEAPFTSGQWSLGCACSLAEQNNGKWDREQLVKQHSACLLATLLRLKSEQTQGAQGCARQESCGHAAERQEAGLSRQECQHSQGSAEQSTGQYKVECKSMRGRWPQECSCGRIREQEPEQEQRNKVGKERGGPDALVKTC